MSQVTSYKEWCETKHGSKLLKKWKSFDTLYYGFYEFQKYMPMRNLNFKTEVWWKIIMKAGTTDTKALGNVIKKL